MEVGTYPIFPIVKKVEYITVKGMKVQGDHWQVTLDGAYAFMDY